MPSANISAATRQRASVIRLACFDVDGVLTDGRLWFGNEGEALKTFHVHDGLGLKRLQAAGVEVAIISARTSAIVSKRMAELGITEVHQGVKDKLDCVAVLAASLGVALREVSFTGDDLPDRAVMDRAGLAIAVANAAPEVQAVAHYITTRRGGEGAVREVCDLLLSSRQVAGASRGGAMGPA